MTGKKYVVIIVDDHALFAQGLALLLANRPGGCFEVAGHTTHVEEAASLAAACHADLAIVDLTMPPLGGLVAIRQIKKRCPQTKVLALSGSDDIELADRALREGADGYLPKTSDPDALVAPLQALASGLHVLDRPLLDALLAGSRRTRSELLDKLTSQELRLWLFLASGMETAEIAQRMLVSERTGKRMVASLLHKIGAANRIEAAGMAGRLGLLDDLALQPENGQAH
ncbi:response regulator transcription factor [Actinocorallia sp. B10E7]|uniref:response regulator transcription factor n=1 Tax=Actinocorallia sp. B10E7 TaxID=3153558 RepID=UPI00325EA0F7